MPVLLEAQSGEKLEDIIGKLDTIRMRLNIPGMAAAVMKDDAIVFARGFGYADIKKQVKATENTVFRVASVTKTFTSTIIMQLVEQGKLNLDDPISKYGLDLGNPAITVRQLLTHTSEGIPGSYYQYNGYRYGRLGPVIEKITGIPFYQTLMEQIVKPAKMESTAMCISHADMISFTGEHKDMRTFFDKAFQNLAVPYELDTHGQTVETHYLDEYGAFGGLATTIGDLLRYSVAIDRNLFVNAVTQHAIFTPNRNSKGVATPYGLGWFTQQFQGIDYYWHYGQTQGESALFVKVPSKHLTMAVMANTDKLSQPFPLGDGDLFTSPVGQKLAVQLFYQ